MKRLIAKIEARNKVNSECNRLLPIMIDYFRPFVGKKILIAGNELASKVKDNLPKSELFFYHDRSSYYIYFNLRAESRHADGNGYQRAEQVITIGEIKDGVLIRLNETPQSWRTNYNAEEVIAARKKCEEARDALRQAENGLHGFGEHDSF